MNHNQKVAFITGGNKGIGLETARGLGKLGYAVVIGARDAGRGEAAVKALRADGVAAVEAIRFDVGSPADHRAAFEHIERVYGKLDALVNNAGIAVEEADFGNPAGFNTVTSVTPEQLRKTFDTNFFDVVALTQALLPLVRKSPAGRIVNLGSVLGSLALHADPTSPIYNVKGFAYDASKTALNAFTVHLAHALRDTPIKVNTAHPGWVKTDLGGEHAPHELSEGGKTSFQLATLPADGPTGGYFHLGERLPW